MVVVVPKENDVMDYIGIPLEKAISKAFSRGLYVRIRDSRIRKIEIVPHRNDRVIFTTCGGIVVDAEFS